MVNLRDEFISTVVEPFTAAYAKGITPNPCILCNKMIKFPHLVRVAGERGAEAIATGHYARVERQSGSAEALLKKGIDSKKDQSYVLYVLDREALERLVLPLGTRRKEEIRQRARELGLSAAERPESQEICFVEDRYYFRLVEELTGGSQGPLIDSETGTVLGHHGGIHRYTIGQRKRLGIATGAPRYVTGIDPASNAVYVGPREGAMTREFLVREINWLLPIAEESFRAGVKVRSTMSDEPATIAVLDHAAAKVIYDEPQWAPAPGQSAVFYDGDTVVGGGVISR